MNFDRFSEDRDRILDGVDWDEVDRMADDYADWLKSRQDDLGAPNPAQQPLEKPKSDGSPKLD